ncbi:MAG TPA: matrixin family metalloprotease [Solirubrobacterales bacterium]|nr:matrixin family metalloprotease [Solirubrobacterales bacterium]
MSRFLTTAVATLLAAVALAGLAEDASAYRTVGKPWPGQTITYHPGADNRWVVAKAAEAWNTSGVGVKLRSVRDRTAADVAISVIPSRRCRGFAQLGWSPYVKQATLKLAGGCDADLGAVGVAAHEFGHILGLEHEPRTCAVMGPRSYGPICGRPGYDEWHCSVLKADDVRGAVKLYGGRPKLGRQGVCSAWSTPVQAAAPRVAVPPRPGGYGALRLELTAPEKLRLVMRAPYISPLGADPIVEVSEPALSCPIKPDPASVIAFETGRFAPGQAIATATAAPLNPGRYCIVAWNVSSTGVVGPASVPTWFDIAPAPPFEALG